jgi:hypothetical protein
MNVMKRNLHDDVRGPVVSRVHWLLIVLPVKKVTGKNSVNKFTYITFNLE